MTCLNRLLIIVSLYNFTAFAQDTLTNAINIKAIREQVKNEKTFFKPRTEFTKKQNDLLREKHVQKVDAELKLLDPKLVITEGKLYETVYPIFQKLVTANPSIPQQTRLVIYRSSVFNAFTMGDHVIFVHIGLLYSLKNESEIALVLAHEIAHNTLKHVENSMVQSVLFETNDSLKTAMKSIMRNEYGRVSALNELLLPRILETREESREHEYDADSLGLVYAKQAGFKPEQAITMFQAMEEHKDKLSEPLDLSVCLQLQLYPAILEKSKSYSSGGSLGSFEEDETWEPYLATHPYERQRFVKLARQENLDTLYSHYKRSTDAVYLVNHVVTSYEIMEAAIKNKNLSEALYYSCKHLIDFPGDQQSYEVLANTLLTLGFTKERRSSGKYLDRQNPEQPEDYDRICAFAYSLSPADCQMLAKEIQTNHLKEKSAGESQAHAMIKLFEFLKAEKYDYFEALWLTEKDRIYESNYGWILKEIENYLYTTKKVKFLNPNK